MRKQLRGRQVWQEGGNKKKKREEGKGKASSPCTFINTYLLILILRILNFDIKSRDYVSQNKLHFILKE
jgi:hypothetical protein